MNYYIDTEIILGRKITPITYAYIMMIIVITLSLIIFISLFHYKTYYDIKGVVEKNDDFYHIGIYMPLEDIHYLVNNNIVRINKKEYKYKILSISDEYLTDNAYTYQKIIISINIPSKYKINNLNLFLQFQKDDKRVIDYIIRR